MAKKKAGSKPAPTGIQNSFICSLRSLRLKNAIRIFDYVTFVLYVVKFPTPNLPLLELRHNFFGEQADVFQRHLLRHAAEVKRSRDRRQIVRFGPFADRVSDALGIAR